MRYSLSSAGNRRRISLFLSEVGKLSIRGKSILVIFEYSLASRRASYIVGIGGRVLSSFFNAFLRSTFCR